MQKQMSTYWQSCFKCLSLKVLDSFFLNVAYVYFLLEITKIRILNSIMNQCPFTLNYISKDLKQEDFFHGNKSWRNIEFSFEISEATSLKFIVATIAWSILSAWCTVCYGGLHSLPIPHPQPEKEEKRVYAPVRKIRHWYTTVTILSFSRYVSSSFSKNLFNSSLWSVNKNRFPQCVFLSDYDRIDH